MLEEAMGVNDGSLKSVPEWAWVDPQLMVLVCRQ